MSRPGTFGGFPFDPEVFSDFMQEQPTWSNNVIASGAVVNDPTIMGLIGTEGNVATLRMYKALSAEGDMPLNNDGKTDNTPTEVTGKKQTAMLIQLMKAWKALDFTKELTGADPLNNVAGQVANYYQQAWQHYMLAIADTVLSVTALASHVTDLSAATGTPGADNSIKADTLIMAEQKALGDMAGSGMGMIAMHSMIYAKYKAMGLVEYNKYTIANALEDQVLLPSIGGKIPLVTDRFTVDTSGANPIYKTFLFGAGAFLTAEKTNYENPFYTKYDPEAKAGTEMLYTKQGRVLHPNGISLAADNIAAESPTLTELSTKANWSLVADPKNVRIGVIKSNG